MLRTWILVALLLTAALSVPLSSAADDGEPRSDIAPKAVSFNVTPPPHSGLAQIKVTAIEINGATSPAPDMANALDQVVSSLAPEARVAAVTTVLPDREGEVAPSYEQTAESLSSRLPSGFRQKIRMPIRHFGDWFQKRRFRLTMFVFDFTTMTGIRYTELMISPQPIEHAPALTAAMLIGGSIAAIEWHWSHFRRFIYTPGKVVNHLLAGLREGARASERSRRVSNVLEVLSQYAKNASLSFAVIGVFKIIIYSAAHAGGTPLERILDTLESLETKFIGDVAVIAIGATLVSFPNTKALAHYKAKKLAEAAGDEKSIERIQKSASIISSVTLAIRATLLTTAILGGTLNMPEVKFGALSGLALMLGGSLWTLRDAASSPVGNLCSDAFL